MASGDPAHSTGDESGSHTLRGPLLTRERLLEHAAELAQKHGTPRDVRLAPLPAHFNRLRRELRDAYVALARDVRAVREPSPSEEWLLDNVHVVEDQVREVATDLPRGYLVKLPRLAGGSLRGFPRVYALCLDYLRHSDARVDPELLIAYVRAYQSVTPLTIGELWAVPIMLRLGLLMIVTQLARAAASDDHAQRARHWSGRLTSGEPEAAAAALAALAREQVTAGFLVELERMLHDHEVTSEAAMRWIRERASALGDGIEELGRRYHLQRAGDQLSVGNAITSMRTISAFMWTKFFEATSLVEDALVRDPAEAYARSHDETRDRCRHAVERIARSSRCSEAEVADTALALALASSRRAAAGAESDPARDHVGFYLIGDGRVELERLCRARPALSEQARRFLYRHATALYLGGVALFTLLGAAFAHELLAALGAGPWLSASLAFLVLCPIAEVVLGLVNTLAVMAVPPRLLARLDFERGIPEEHRTLVVVPCLLEDEHTVERLLAHLEIRALANADERLTYALLSDFVDAASAECPEDAALLELAQRGVTRLNERHGKSRDGTPRFALLHRRRVWNASERRFLGWERKRGKLEELNALLRGSDDTTFSVVTVPSALLRAVRYVITLDADTELPRGAAHKLVGTIAHPLNRPYVDPGLQRVTRGYAILQPRVGPTPRSTRRTRYARIMAGQLGIDPYTLAVSDVYQDLHGEGSYNGKGIYDVDAFARATAGRIPENRVLSHDLLESLFARCALVSDIELLDEQPASYEAAARRQHRWVRGDWQLVPYAFGRVKGLSALGRFKLIDNLRRSLVAPSLCVAVLWSALALPAAAPGVVALLVLVLTAPLLVRVVTELVRSAPSELGAVWGGFLPNVEQTLLQGAFLLDEAVLSLDAIGRTLYRLSISKRRLLQWQSMDEVQRFVARASMHIEPRLWFGSVLAAAALGACISRAPAALPAIAPLLLGWMLVPSFALWLGRPVRSPDRRRALSDEDVRELRATARRTWRFFETFVTAEDNFLPPDNFQEEPRPVVAHRTSPTNIGLYLLSVVAARDFGFITLQELADRIGQTLDTLFRFERREGHILNWYETTTLRPLEPKYVSTVDSGNLAAYLWTLKASCDELIARPVVGPELLAAVEDALRLASSEEGKPQAGLIALVRDTASALASGTRGGLRALAELRSALLEHAAELPGSPWRERAASTAARGCDELRAVAPFALLAEPPPALSSGRWAARLAGLHAALEHSRTPAELAQLSERVGAPLRAWLQEPAELRPSGEGLAYLAELLESVERGSEHASALCERLANEGARARAFADRMDFGFLLDPERALFSIGYDVGGARLDGSYYDLLASEARVASLFAIAKGDVPEKHWFRLGRPRTSAGGERALLSWSGSMFEYLMPLLVTRNHADTLLHETCESAVLAHAAHGREHGVPWGVSEAAYNVMDLSMTYQYRAFGVQALGLKAGLADDLVIAPYATMLAAQTRPDLALPNLRALARAGVLGEFGYYEAIDYTKTRVPPGREGVVVKAYFAHHQGMSLVALDNALNGAPMPRRFHRDPRMQATELLLEERVPQAVPAARDRVLRSPAPVAADSELTAVEHVGLAQLGEPRAHLLGHGELATLVTARGTGFTAWRKLDVHRFCEDALLEPSGVFIYLRNLTRPLTWSAGFEPTRVKPLHYDAAFAPHRVDIQRRDAEIETILHVTVSPEHAADVRRLTLVNHGAEACEIEITTYTEVVLAPRAADRAHRAFSGMFVQTEAIEGRAALLATRRPRRQGEFQPWLTQVLAAEQGAFGELEYESSRDAFLGRGRTVHAPRALEPGERLSCRTGDALDPAFALRRTVRLAPGEHASIALTTALASTREQALELAQMFSAQSGIERSFELAWADAAVELRHLGISAAQSHRFQRLLTAVLWPRASLRAPLAADALQGEGRRVLWSQGLSDDLPLLIVRLDEGEPGELCRELLLAHEFFRLNNQALELLLLNDEPAGYLQPVQDRALALVHARLAHAQLDQRGGIFVRRSSHLSQNERNLLLAAGRVVLPVSQGSLARQLRRAAERAAALAPVLPWKPQRPPARARVTSPPPGRPALQFDNGLGGFSADGREYVMTIGPGVRPPAPWCNVIANPQFGAVISEAGGGFTWSQNSQRHRITAFSNDPTCDPAGEVIYLRDDDDGSTWSATPAPAGGDASYLVRHGQGYSVFSHERDRLEHELTIGVDAERPLKLFRLRLRNLGDRSRTLSLFAFVDWVLGTHRDTSRAGVATRFEPAASALLATSCFSAFPRRCAFLSATEAPRSVGCDRDEFVGINGSRERPRALAHVALGGQSGFGCEPCAALHHVLTLAPGATREIGFALGEGESVEAALALAHTVADVAAIGAALERTRDAWDALLGRVQVETSDRALDLLLNRFLPYQVLSCRLWARSAFYQSGGAYGFRDQLQDVLALLHVRPDLAREQLLRCAARQFVQGDVQHWWHPETGEGVRTHCSDDMLWLPFATAEYVRVTGDLAVLDEPAPFLEERRLEPEEHDIYSVPRVASESASLYEHCLRAIDAGTTAGAHNLPLMRGGDWNDGMDRVGALGQGESVWLGFFLARVLEDGAELARGQHDAERAQAFLRSREQLCAALEAHGWDGAWYRRAFCDDGSVLGSVQSAECRIDAIAQAWAVLSGCARPARAAQALAQAERQLSGDGIMRLLTPPFQGAIADPGYIRAYPPGVRENGGQYTHGALWVVQALACSGEMERAHALLSMLNPIHHARDAAEVARYAIEPYVVAADVYAARQLVGRGGWSWYTGAAGWMYRIALEHMLGFHVRDGHVYISPARPAAFERYRLVYRRGESVLEIEVGRAGDGEQPGAGAWLDGQVVSADAARIPADGERHSLKVVTALPAALPARAGSAARRS
jgi:cellobiose phosphorylase